MNKFLIALAIFMQSVSVAAANPPIIWGPGNSATLLAGKFGIGLTAGTEAARVLHVDGTSSGSGGSLFQFDITTLGSPISLWNANTTDGNSTNISFRTTTTGVGAASNTEIAGIRVKTLLHDHPTRTASYEVFTTIGGTAAVRFHIDSVGHHNVGGVASVIGSCGTSPSVSGNDMVGKITVGTGGVATSCAITFATTWTSAPVCVAQSETDISAFKVVSTTTALTITAAAPFTASSILNYHCIGKQ